jgi:hypothetical protein
MNHRAQLACAWIGMASTALLFVGMWPLMHFLPPLDPALSTAAVVAIYRANHLVHVLLGMGVLMYLLVRSKRPDPGTSYVALMEGGGAFWHLVDLLWVVLFPLLYLLR